MTEELVMGYQRRPLLAVLVSCVSFLCVVNGLALEEAVLHLNQV